MPADVFELNRQASRMRIAMNVENPSSRALRTMFRYQRSRQNARSASVRTNLIRRPATSSMQYRLTRRHSRTTSLASALRETPALAVMFLQQHLQLFRDAELHAPLYGLWGLAVGPVQNLSAGCYARLLAFGFAAQTGKLFESCRRILLGERLDLCGSLVGRAFLAAAGFRRTWFTSRHF